MPVQFTSKEEADVAVSAGATMDDLKVSLAIPRDSVSTVQVCEWIACACVCVCVCMCVCVFVCLCGSNGYYPF
jgi:hypothetical protein